MTRIAVLSDVHGNTPALAAVLAAIDAEGADLVLNLGDIASGAVDPRGTMDLLAARTDIVTVRGNRVEVGAPEARYAIVSRVGDSEHVPDGSRVPPGGWVAELRAVRYDHEEAAASAEQLGRPDIAHALRTGRLA